MFWMVHYSLRGHRFEVPNIVFLSLKIVFMLLNLKKMKGHIAFGMSVCVSASVHPIITAVITFIEIR